jgi:hypothetical protein
VFDYSQTMRDEEVGQAKFLLQILHEIDYLGLNRDVERRDWLIGYDQVGPQRECPGNANPLALSAAKFMRIPARVVGFESDNAQQLSHLLAKLRAARDAMNYQRLADDGGYRHSWIERRIGILKDDLHPAAESSQSAFPKAQEVHVIEHNAAFGRLNQTQQAAANGSLAASGFAYETQRLASFDSQ